MKIGIITDIHSNSQALDAVLKEFDRIKVEKTIEKIKRIKFPFYKEILKIFY